MATVSLLANNANVPNRLTVVDEPAHNGGEGRVHFSSDGRYVVKIYHRPARDKQKLLQNVIELGKNLGEDGEFLAWPMAIAGSFNGKPCVGVVTWRVSDTYVPLYRLIHTPREAVEQFRRGKSWLQYLKIARGATAAVRTINGKGMAHADIHPKNFLAEPDSGQVVLIDLDGLVVNGFLPPQVNGAPGFIAPEVMAGQSQPDELTDRHSVAVLVLWTLLLRNVMQTQTCFDDQDPVHDDVLGYGVHACFSENPANRCNWLARIGLPLFRQGLLSYRALTPRLQQLTEQALIRGLHDPPQRPAAAEWERALAEAYDLLVTCRVCRQSFFYPYQIQPARRRQCPFCGSVVERPSPVVAELLEERARAIYVPVRNVVLYDQLPLFADQAEPGRLPPFTRRGLNTIAQTRWDPSRNVVRLFNTGDCEWSTPDGSVPPGRSVTLRPGMMLSFGDRKRLLRIVE